jgi:hypothetical protein
MKNKTKIITLITLGSLALLGYSLSNKKDNKNSKVTIENINLIDKNPSILSAPKVYISTPDKNALEVGNNWKSK